MCTVRLQDLCVTQTDRDGQIDSQASGLKDRQLYRDIDIQKERDRPRQTDSLIETYRETTRIGEKDGQTDTERQTDKVTNRQLDGDMDIQGEIDRRADRLGESDKQR